MLHPRFNPRRALSLAAAVLSVSWSLVAHGAPLVFSGTYPIRVGTPRVADPPPGPGLPPTYGINRADCLGTGAGAGSDTRWQFAINQPLASYQFLEVWVRTDGSAGCTDPGARGVTGLAPICAKVATFAGSKVNANQVFEIPDVAFMAAMQSSPRRTTDDAADGFAADKAARPTACAVAGSMDPINLYVSFLLTSDTAGTLVGDGAELVYTTSYDLAGPLPPVIAVTPGDKLLEAKWDVGSGAPPAAMVGYQAYCFPKGTSFTGSASTSIAAGCGTDVVLPAAFSEGKQPDASLDTYRCGSIAPATSTATRIEGLTNDQTYAVAIGVLDTYGNVGPLSNVVCGTPKAGAGGAGSDGSSSCNCASTGHSTGGAILGLSMLGLMVGLVRRRSSRARAPS